jgi:hypothetical protein
MTAAQYVAALARLGLTPASKAAAEAIGKTVRTSQRYASGEVPVPRTVELLLSPKQRQ